MKYSWKLDNFDSEVFGFKVAKILSIGSKEDVKPLMRELSDNNIKYATYRVETSNFRLIQALQEAKFLIVDGIISLEASLSPLATDNDIPEIREASEKDSPALKKMTLGLYLLSRIYNDPLISKETADKFFVRWVENSVKGKVVDSVLIWDEGGKISGYITLQKKGQIPLIGVSKDARGKGIAKKLIQASFNKFREWGVKNVIIETQISNIAALRVDQDCGFKPVKSYLTLRWAENV